MNTRFRNSTSIPFLSPPPFEEGIYSFPRVRMCMSLYVSFRRRSEDTDRISTFNL